MQRILTPLLVAVVMFFAMLFPRTTWAAQAEGEPVNLEVWCYRAILQMSPPESVAKIRKDETEEQIRERYKLIARDVAIAVDKSVPFHKGKFARYQQAAMTLSIAYFESGFKKSVAAGLERGDSGRSWCFMQINIGKGNVYVGDDEMKTWKGTDLITDHSKCFRVGIQVMRLSMGQCRGRKDGDILSAYTSGRCQDNEPKARARWDFVKTILARNPTFEVKAES